MTLPDEDENILFSEVVDFSIFPLSPGRRRELRATAELPSISDLLGVKDVRDDDEVAAAIWEAYDRLYTQFSAPRSSSPSPRLSPSLPPSSPSSSSSFSPSTSSSSSSVSPPPVCGAASVHVFCSPQHVRDGFRVLFSFAFEAETGERSPRESLVLAALSASLLRCPACVVAYVAGCRQFLLALQSGESRDRKNPQRPRSEEPHEAGDSLADGEDSDEEGSLLCARLQKKILAWDLLRLLAVLAADRDRREEEDRREEAAGKKADFDIGDREDPGGQKTGKEADISLSGDTAGNRERCSLLSLVRTGVQTALDKKAEVDKGCCLATKEDAASPRTPAPSSGPASENALCLCFPEKNLQTLLRRLSQHRSTLSSDLSSRVSASRQPSLSFRPSPCSSAPPLPSCSSVDLPSVCTLLEVLLDSARLLYVDFDLPLKSLQEDLRDFGSSIPALFLPLLRNQECLPARDRGLETGVCGDCSGPCSSPSLSSVGHAEGSADGEKPREGRQVRRAEDAGFEEEGSGKEGDEEAPRKEKERLWLRMTTSAFCSLRGLTPETRERLSGHRRTLRSLVVALPSLLASSPVDLSSARCSELWEASVSSSGFAASAALPPSTLLLPLLPSPVFCVGILLYALLLRPCGVAPLLLSFQTHALPAVRLAACAALHIAAVRRPSLLLPPSSPSASSCAASSASASSLAFPVSSAAPSSFATGSKSDPVTICEEAGCVDEDGETQGDGDYSKGERHRGEASCDERRFASPPASPMSALVSVVQMWVTLLHILSVRLGQATQEMAACLQRCRNGAWTGDPEMEDVEDNVVSSLHHLVLILRALHSLFVVVLSPDSTPAVAEPIARVGEEVFNFATRLPPSSSLFPFCPFSSSSAATSSNPGSSSVSLSLPAADSLSLFDASPPSSASSVPLFSSSSLPSSLSSSCCLASSSVPSSPSERHVLESHTGARQLPHGTRPWRQSPTVPGERGCGEDAGQPARFPALGSVAAVIQEELSACASHEKGLLLGAAEDELGCLDSASLAKSRGETRRAGCQDAARSDALFPPSTFFEREEDRAVLLREGLYLLLPFPSGLTRGEAGRTGDEARGSVELLLDRNSAAIALGGLPRVLKTLARGLVELWGQLEVHSCLSERRAFSRTGAGFRGGDLREAPASEEEGARGEEDQSRPGLSEERGSQVGNARRARGFPEEAAVVLGSVSACLSAELTVEILVLKTLLVAVSLLYKLVRSPARSSLLSSPASRPPRHASAAELSTETFSLMSEMACRARGRRRELAEALSLAQPGGERRESRQDGNPQRRNSSPRTGAERRSRDTRGGLSAAKGGESGLPEGAQEEGEVGREKRIFAGMVWACELLERMSSSIARFLPGREEGREKDGDAGKEGKPKERVAARANRGGKRIQTVGEAKESSESEGACEDAAVSRLRAEILGASSEERDPHGCHPSCSSSSSRVAASPFLSAAPLLPSPASRAREAAGARAVGATRWVCHSTQDASTTAAGKTGDSVPFSIRQEQEIILVSDSEEEAQPPRLRSSAPRRPHTHFAVVLGDSDRRASAAASLRAGDQEHARGGNARGQGETRLLSSPPRAGRGGAAEARQPAGTGSTGVASTLSGRETSAAEGASLEEPTSRVSKEQGGSAAFSRRDFCGPGDAPGVELILSDEEESEQGQLHAQRAGEDTQEQGRGSSEGARERVVTLDWDFPEDDETRREVELRQERKRERARERPRSPRAQTKRQRTADLSTVDFLASCVSSPSPWTSRASSASSSGSASPRSSSRSSPCREIRSRARSPSSRCSSVVSVRPSPSSSPSPPPSPSCPSPSPAVSSRSSSRSSSLSSASSSSFSTSLSCSGAAGGVDISALWADAEAARDMQAAAQEARTAREAAEKLRRRQEAGVKKKASWTGRTREQARDDACPSRCFTPSDSAPGSQRSASASHAELTSVRAEDEARTGRKGDMFLGSSRERKGEHAKEGRGSPPESQGSFRNHPTHDRAPPASSSPHPGPSPSLPQPAGALRHSSLSSLSSRPSLPRPVSAQVASVVAAARAQAADTRWRAQRLLQARLEGLRSRREDWRRGGGVSELLTTHRWEKSSTHPFGSLAVFPGAAFQKSKLKAVAEKIGFEGPVVRRKADTRREGVTTPGEKETGVEEEAQVERTGEEERAKRESRKAEQIRRMRRELEKGLCEKESGPAESATLKRHILLAPSGGDVRAHRQRSRKPAWMSAEEWEKEKLRAWVQQEVDDAQTREVREKKAQEQSMQNEQAEQQATQRAQEEALKRKHALDRARIITETDAGLDQFLWRLLHVDVHSIARGDEEGGLHREKPQSVSPPSSPPPSTSSSSSSSPSSSSSSSSLSSSSSSSFSSSAPGAREARHSSAHESRRGDGACVNAQSVQRASALSPAEAKAPPARSKYSLELLTSRVRAQRHLPNRYRNVEEYKSLLAPLLFLELIFQLKQAFREQNLEPRLCVLEELREGKQWMLGRLSMSRIFPQLAAFARTPGRQRNVSSRLREPPSFSSAADAARGSDRGGEPDTCGPSSSFSGERGEAAECFFPPFGVHELLLLLPVGSAYTRLLDTARGDREGDPESAEQTTVDHAQLLMRRYAGKSFAAIAREPVQSWFLLGLVDRVEDTSPTGFSASGSQGKSGIHADSDSERSAAEKSSGGSQFILRLPHLVSSDLSPAASHQMKRVPLEHVAVNTSWVAVSLTQLTTAVREIQAVFLSQLSPRFPFLLNPLPLKLSLAPVLPSASSPSPSPSASLPASPSPSSAPSADSKRQTRGAALAAVWFKQAVDRQLRSGRLNPSQAEAIRDVLTTETKVGLIQGPPGTGKTQAIQSLLAIIYSRLRDQQGLRAKEGSNQPSFSRSLRSSGALNPPGRHMASPGAAREGLRKKILVCAPSNAAVDEIAERLLAHGLQHPMTGETFTPACLRIGNLDRVRESVRSITLEAQVKRLRSAHESQMETSFQASLQELREKKKVLIQQHQCVRFLLSRFSSLDLSRLNSAPYLDDLVAAMLASSFAKSFSGEARGEETLRSLLPSLACLGLFGLKDLRATLDAQLEDVNARFACLFDERRQDRSALFPACRQQVILATDIVFATLSSSAHEYLCPYTLTLTSVASSPGRGASLSRGFSSAPASLALSSCLPGLPRFATQEQKMTFLQAQFYAASPPFSYAYLIVDEAGQASELSCLIPLRLAPERCILVGDPQQLPSTIFSALAEKRGLGRSLLERLALCAEEDRQREARPSEERGEERRWARQTASKEARAEDSKQADEGDGLYTRRPAEKNEGFPTEEPEGERRDEERQKRLVKAGVSLALGATNRPHGTQALKVNLLTTQYRMRAEIARFPSEAFYDGRLETSPSVSLRPRLPCFRLHWLFAPVKFFRVPSLEDRGSLGSSSLANYEEARFVVSLLRTLYLHFCGRPQSEHHTRHLGYSPSFSSPAPSSFASRSQKLSDVGVITPYRQQVALLQQMLAEDLVLGLARDRPEINTVDAFQGREKSIIIISFVRAAGPAALAARTGDDPASYGLREKHRGPKGTGNEAGKESPSVKGRKAGIAPRTASDLPETSPGASPVSLGPSSSSSFSTLGFVADFRRLNVALTRARDALWIVGDDETLKTHPSFRRFLAYVQSLPGDAYIDLLDLPKPLRRAMQFRRRDAGRGSLDLSAQKHRCPDAPRSGAAGRMKLWRDEEEGLLSEFFGAVEEDFRQTKKLENGEGQRQKPGEAARGHATLRDSGETTGGFARTRGGNDAEPQTEGRPGRPREEKKRK
ncbi:putative tRNA-splicing endonuclease positive effector [Neospora caninum Liverpool]|uniref:Putative tRNA-splicing endonuclease positive effector n=1 Tax=Neospora caninum (strain Liverpool) TaxID=572307 RepID=F0VI36_NEOCL|nr:putative tRNA-splicing endonuclease positive effector [Neospora caninum Liverpool]CBZ53397.1 putative tRNA-splicing endonuclease positive effector [Neospora caninum Liverpool]CEL67384.1 TPA: tRNA-splicing endonuclease positive effector,putative [Neospora caninum Liverpool]|eukprot:XP_003883429.1 putative tRNA-splicing endonuclease positive effector [Neospora caninum Liverpool]